MGLGIVYRASWINHLPETADLDDGPNYQTVELECKHKTTCYCRERIVFHATHCSARGPKPGYCELHAFKIKNIRIPRGQYAESRKLQLLYKRCIHA